jgi:hypothetical protein
MATWYKANKYDNYIEEIEVSASTDKTVTTKRGREFKHTDYIFFAETKQECIVWRKKFLVGKIKESWEAYERAQSKLADFQTKYGVDV